LKEDVGVALLSGDTGFPVSPYYLFNKKMKTSKDLLLALSEALVGPENAIEINTLFGHKFKNEDDPMSDEEFDEKLKGLIEEIPAIKEWALQGFLRVDPKVDSELKKMHEKKYRN
jgi:hypothetical protein